MLTNDMKRNPDSYSYPNGMLNSAWIGGVLRLPPNGAKDGLCYIQKTRSENHMLPIHFDPRKSPLPHGMQEWDLVMAYCHVSCEWDGVAERIIKLTSILFEGANIMHMGAGFAEKMIAGWSAKVHPQAKDSGVPDSISELATSTGINLADPAPQTRIDSFDWKAAQMNQNATNRVRLAGFIEALSLEKNRMKGDMPMNDRLTVLLRQTANPDKSIPIRWYGSNVEILYKKMVRSMPIIVDAEYMMDVKAIGPADPQSGLAPVSKLPYLKSKDVPQPATPSSRAIRVAPIWVSDLIGSRKSQSSQLAKTGAANTDNAAPADDADGDTEERSQGGTAPAVNGAAAAAFTASFEKDPGATAA